LLDRCKVLLFVPIFQSDCVGTFARDDAASPQATVSALKKITMSSCHPTSGVWVNMQPDEAFTACSTNLIPLPPFQVSVWGLNLVTQHFDSLSMEFQDELHVDPSYAPPDLSALVTRSAQLDALCCLRFAAVRQHTLLRYQEKLIAKTVNRKLKHAHQPTALAAPASVLLPPPSFSSIPGVRPPPRMIQPSLARLCLQRKRPCAGTNLLLKLCQPNFH
jgi:hypothetical protein